MSRTDDGVSSSAAETVVRIESVPLIDADQLLNALQAEGVRGSVVGLEPLAVRVARADVGLLAQRVFSAVDGLALVAARPMISERVGPLSFVVRPAAG
jgi:hypothetical protein